MKKILRKMMAGCAAPALVMVMALPLMLAGALPAEAVRIKDIATFSGMRDNQLVGYGLVVGLSGTGDKRKSAPYTADSMKNMLERMGVSADAASINSANVAAVMVTARLPLTAKPGSKQDITVSSIGDAKSLLGGVLLQTPLKGIDGKIYALAQGPLVLGGYSADGVATSVQKNVSTVAYVPGGATIERAVPFDFNQQEQLTLNMHTSDFSTTMEVVEQLNTAMGGRYASAPDAGNVTIRVPAAYRGNLVPLIASVENLEITPQYAAKVVVDERTGTVVLGKDVRVSQVAVSHGNLQLVVQESAEVSQPNPFSQGQTVAVPQTDVTVNEERRRLHLLEGATLQELVDGLNAIGASPQDLISILKTLRVSGALHAQLEVI